MTPLAFHRALVLVSLMCGSLGCTTSFLTDRSWIEVRSENFTITSCMDTEKTVALVHEMEFFRAAVLTLTRVSSVESSIPTHIYVFDSLGGLRSFRPRNVSGYIVTDLRGFYVGLQDSRKMDAGLVLKHEYVHFLLRNRTKFVYPRWFDEGFAEFMSTMRVVGDYAAVGVVPEQRVKQFGYGGWMPLRKILTYDGTQRWSDQDVGLFYAQSWALIHYLLHDEQSRLKFSTVIDSYLSRTEEGSSVTEASESAFGMSSQELDRSLQSYLRHGEFEPFGVKISALKWSSETTVRSIGRALVAERLGELALHGQDRDLAGRLFARSLAFDPDRPRAIAGMGDVLTADEQWEEAEAHFQRALELGSDDPLNHLDFGEYWHFRAEKIEDPDQRRTMLKRARRLYVKANQLDDTRPEPYAVYGATFLLDGEDAKKGIETLEHAEDLLPSNPQIRFWLASAYSKIDRHDEARVLLKRIIGWGHGGAYAARAQTLLEELNADESRSADSSGS